MNWYRENRWLGNFLIAFAAATLLAIWPRECLRAP